MSPPSSHTSNLTYKADAILDSRAATVLIILIILMVIAILVAVMSKDCIREFFHTEDRRDIVHIPIIIYGSGDVAAANSECSICLDKFTAADEIRVLPQCRHGFHVKCIDAWLRELQSCPNCRRSLVVEP